MNWDNGRPWKKRILAHIGRWLQGRGKPSLNQYGKLIPRDDGHLVRVVEELAEGANGHAATLRIVTIPDDVKWIITKIEGGEQVSEVHRTWVGAR